MGKHEDILIKKASGKEEYFSFQKLRNSLLRSGANQDEVEAIIEQMKNQLFNGMSTKKIYSTAFRLLKKSNSSNASACRYYLKQGIMELGPSGFPFEKYISELFRKEGYHVETGVFIQGKCVSHEVDVLCKKGNSIMLMECKYKNQSGLSVDVKVPLYINSRFQDILDHGLISSKYTEYKGWIVTNSRFTEDAKIYGTCRGLNLLGWDYPVNRSLKEIIDQTGLYPITCLTKLSQSEKKQILDKNIVLISELLQNKKLLHRIGIAQNRIDQILLEGENLCRVE